MKPHYVYYLYTADKEDRLMEVGRSINPAKRRRIKELKHGMAFRMLTRHRLKVCPAHVRMSWQK